MRKFSYRGVEKVSAADVTDADQFAGLMRRIAGPRLPSERETHCIYRGGAPVGFSRRQSIRHWYKQVSVIPFSLMTAAIAAAAAAEAKRVERSARAVEAADRLAEEAKNEFAEFKRRLARVEALLVQDPDFYRDQVDALRSQMGDQDRPVDR